VMGGAILCPICGNNQAYCKCTRLEKEQFLEIARLREERRSISTLLQKVENLESDNAQLRNDVYTLRESEMWGVGCKPSPSVTSSPKE